MARVKDTGSFIAKARQVHGDRYDYSQTVYRGSGKPITIVCRVHGAFELAEPGQHFRPKKGVPGSGCRKCNIMAAVKDKGLLPRPIVKCGQCGKQFQIDKSKLKRNENCFCSLDCRLQRDRERKRKAAADQKKKAHRGRWRRKLDFMAVADYSVKEKSWAERFRNMAYFNGIRAKLSKQLPFEDKGLKTWKATWRRMEKKGIPKGELTWKEKLNSMASNAKARMNRKSLVKGSKS